MEAYYKSVVYTEEISFTPTYTQLHPLRTARLRIMNDTEGTLSWFSISLIGALLDL
jgi:hypothetical protein